jgi:hypothetical protein
MRTIQSLEKDMFYPFTSSIEAYLLVLELLSYAITAKRLISLTASLTGQKWWF